MITREPVDGDASSNRPCCFGGEEGSKGFGAAEEGDGVGNRGDACVNCR